MCKCNNNCNNNPDVTRQILINNNSLGRDGESAYDIYVRLGGELTEKEWIDSLNQSNYEESNW